MKTTLHYTTVLLLVCSPLLLKSQMWKYLVQDSSMSVLKAIDSAETWFQADTTRMSNSFEQYKNFKRFQWGIMNRLDSGGFRLPSNDKYLMALENIYNASPLPSKPGTSTNLYLS